MVNPPHSMSLQAKQADDKEGVLLGVEKPYHIFQTLWQTQKIPHALLFKGVSGIGKRLFAQWVAWQLLRGQVAVAQPESQLLQELPCVPKCALYRRMIHGGHGDFLYIQPEKNKVAQIRKIVDFFRKKPMEGQWRIVIVDDVHTLNFFSVNALLKILEEPPRHCLLILISKPQFLLPTLVSRCWKIDFSPLSQKAFECIMEASSYTQDKEKMQLGYCVSGGSPGGAHKMITTQAIDMFIDFIKTLRFLTHKDFAPIISFVRRWEVPFHDEAYHLFPEMLLRWSSHLFKSLLTGNHSMLTCYERNVLPAFYTDQMRCHWATCTLQASKFFHEANIFHLDRGAVWYTFFLKLFFDQWKSISTSQRLFTT